MFIRRMIPPSAAAAALVALAGCSTPAQPSGDRSAAPARSSSISMTLPTPTTADPRVYGAGDTLTGQEFAAELLARMADQSFQPDTTVRRSRVKCAVTGVVDGDISIAKPAAGIAEVRVLGNMAYVADKPGTARPWFAFDMASGQDEVPSQAIADALNLVDDVVAGDCRWDERLAAIDPAGTVKVTAETADGWRFSVPTDPESQRDKHSGSPRTYEDGTWIVSKAGLPVTYRAAGSSRVVSYSNWSKKEIAAPPDDQIHP